MEQDPNYIILNDLDKNNYENFESQSVANLLLKTYFTNQNKNDKNGVISHSNSNKGSSDNLDIFKIKKYDKLTIPKESLNLLDIYFKSVITKENNDKILFNFNKIIDK